MKISLQNLKISKLLFIAITIIIVAVGCKKDIEPVENNSTVVTDMNQLNVDDGFNWSTTKNVMVSLQIRSTDTQALKGVRLFVYSSNPGEGSKNVNKASLVYTGFSDANGNLSVTINVSQLVNKLYVKPMYIGLEEMAEIPIVGGVASYTFGGHVQKTSGKSLYSIGKGQPVNDEKYTYQTLGTWTNAGNPNYLTNSDVISSALLADINASLPEYDPLPSSHPQYLVNGNLANTVLNDSADIWVTFVHEGAGYNNVLGFYTYQKGNEPATPADITNLTIIFPNVSYSGSGGTLSSGAKVHIGSFPANTVIGYFIIANGYNSSTGGFYNGRNIFYSNTNLNPETDATKKQHMVMLNDEDRNLLILGFEDIKRTESGCDNDFNDAIFYVTANPITALETNNVPQIDTPVDDDNDGVSNRFDDYPQDPELAVNNYYPAEGEFGTLSFEDLWPTKGDYDFNDLVLDYQFNQVTNGDNNIVKVEVRLVVRAIGAGYHNGFGFQMDISPTNVASVTGCDLKYNYITVGTNGLETGHSKATIIPFDNAFNVLPSAGGTYVNTIESNPYVLPDTQLVTIVLTAPKTLAQVGSPPYNPFLIANKERGKEIHLPGYVPTTKANSSYFGTGDDNTNLVSGNYYKSENNLPWAMNLPSSFVYPLEKKSIIQGHLKFAQWAQSNGFSYMDWYQDKLGYRQNLNLFHHN